MATSNNDPPKCPCCSNPVSVSLSGVVFCLLLRLLFCMNIFWRARGFGVGVMHFLFILCLPTTHAHDALLLHIQILCLVFRCFSMNMNIQWQAATGDFFAKLCQACEETTTSSSAKGLSRTNMDFDVHPRGERTPHFPSLSPYIARGVLTLSYIIFTLLCR